MERRLVKAYERMTMPDECSRRIERMMNRKMKEKQSRRAVLVIPASPQKQWWAAAAGLVCLVLVLTMGGTFLFLNATDNAAARTPETAASQISVTQAAEQTTGETDAMVEYYKDGLSFRYPAGWQLALGDGMEQFYDRQRAAFWLVRREAWEVNLELDAAGYQDLLRRSGDPNTVVTEVSRVSVDGLDANKVVFTDLFGTITRYDTATEDAGYSFCFAYYQNGQTDTQAEEALMASVRFGAEDKRFVLSDQGKEFLQKMCYYMPDWSGSASLDEAFWKDFLFQSFTSPELTEDGKAMTVCGETEYAYIYRDGMDTSEGQVKISREAVETYVKLAMGYEMPEFTPAYEKMEPGQTALYYKDGYYYIGSSDFGAVGYTFRKWEPDMEAYPTLASVSFDAYIDEPEHVIGTVTFRVYPADNENGFTIVAKDYVSTAEKEIIADRVEISNTAELFSEAYFLGSVEAMKQYLVEPYTQRIETYSGPDTVVVLGNQGMLSDMGEKQVGDTQVVSYAFKESPTADSYTYLTMELVKQEDGWKVKFYGLEK